MTNDSFLSTQLKAWAAVLVCLVIVPILIGVIAHSGTDNSAYQHAANAQSFYAMVDGRAPLNGATVDVALASDLKTLLGAHDGRALPQSITTFQGTSSSYGGITGIVGFDPFNAAGQQCHECGPLTPKMLTVLSDIKSGHDKGLFAEIKVPAPKPVRTTPLGMSWVAWLFILWFGFGYLVGLSSAAWNRAEFKAVEKPSVALWLLTPTFWAGRIGSHWQSRTSQDRKLRKQFPQQMAAIDQVNRLLSHTSGPKATALRMKRDQVLGQLQTQVSSGASLSDELELKKSMAELNDCQDLLDARAKAASELADDSPLS